MKGRRNHGDLKVQSLGSWNKCIFTIILHKVDSNTIFYWDTLDLSKIYFYLCNSYDGNTTYKGRLLSLPFKRKPCFKLQARQHFGKLKVILWLLQRAWGKVVSDLRYWVDNVPNLTSNIYSKLCSLQFKFNKYYFDVAKSVVSLLSSSSSFCVEFGCIIIIIFNKQPLPEIPDPKRQRSSQDQFIEVNLVPIT